MSKIITPDFQQLHRVGHKNPFCRDLPPGSAYGSVSVYLAVIFLTVWPISQPYLYSVRGDVTQVVVAVAGLFGVEFKLANFVVQGTVFVADVRLHLIGSGY